MKLPDEGGSKGNGVSMIWEWALPFERLWRTVKYEEVYLHECTSPKDAYRSLSQYIYFYNY
jgi:hypothetical protein